MEIVDFEVFAQASAIVEAYASDGVLLRVTLAPRHRKHPGGLDFSVVRRPV